MHPPIPEIFVLWHPSCRLGERLALSLSRWLRPVAGLGPEVFFRSAPAPHAPPNGLPSPLPGEVRGGKATPPRAHQKVSKLQVVLPLIDEHLVADPAWRYWLRELTVPAPGVQREMLPVALDACAYNLPQEIRKLNFLRPSGSPLAEGASPAAFDALARSLQKQATEALCRLVLPRPESQRAKDETRMTSEPPPKINVFLSHAKVDGVKPARRLRDYIYSQTQLTAFYDENDIAYGSAFSHVIEHDLGSADTAALIAVRSVKYASRPWCRREFSLFRRPREITGSAKRRWFLYPTLVVEAMNESEPSLGVPEFGGAPAIRWLDGDESMEEKIIMTVVRDVMLASFHAALGGSIPSSPNSVTLNWLPDAVTLLGVPAIRDGLELDVLYPGSGLSMLELEILAELFPRLTFKCFEEALL